MHVLNLYVAAIGMLELRYRGREQAEASRQRIKAAAWDAEMEMQDDYGRLLTVPRADIKAYSLGDVGQDIEAKIEAALLDIAAQQKAAAKAPGSRLALPPGLGMRQ
jgi:hypothetical protein